jgi:hypothetical protein
MLWYACMAWRGYDMRSPRELGHHPSSASIMLSATFTANLANKEMNMRMPFQIR